MGEFFKQSSESFVMKNTKSRRISLIMDGNQHTGNYIIKNHLNSMRDIIDFLSELIEYFSKRFLEQKVKTMDTRLKQMVRKEKQREEMYLQQKTNPRNLPSKKTKDRDLSKPRPLQEGKKRLKQMGLL